MTTSLICDACGEPLAITAKTVIRHDDGSMSVGCQVCSALKHFPKEETAELEAILATVSEAESRR